MSTAIFHGRKIEAPGLPARGTHARSIMKAVSWRMTGTLDTFIVSFLVTGNVTIAGSIAAIEILSKILLCYCHERAWAMIRWGTRPAVPR
jgi:uncharacterized membrane protein